MPSGVGEYSRLYKLVVPSNQLGYCGCLGVKKLSAQYAATFCTGRIFYAVAPLVICLSTRTQYWVVLCNGFFLLCRRFSWLCFFVVGRLELVVAFIMFLCVVGQTSVLVRAGDADVRRPAPFDLYRERAQR